MPAEAEAFDPEEILATIDLQSIIERMNLQVERRKNESEIDYIVESQMVEFEDDQLVFLESGERRHPVIDFDEAQRPKVVRMTCKDLEPGMFLVLRISGGRGDQGLPRKGQVYLPGRNPGDHEEKRLREQRTKRRNLADAAIQKARQEW